MNKQPCENHARIYEDFVRDLRNDTRYPFIKNVEDYTGESVIKLCPSQHPLLSAYQQKKRTDKFVEFLSNEVYPITEMQVCTLVNQKLFDAICHQNHLESLRIKGFNGTDISAITKLTKLKKLFIESGVKISDISPLADLKQLEVLILGNTKQISDYSCLAALQHLKVLGICRYQADYNAKPLRMTTDKFIQEMPHLEWVDLVDCEVDESGID